MLSSSVSSPVATPEELSALLGQVESSLQALSEAARLHDADRMGLHAQEIHRALAPVIDAFGAAARQGALPAALRQRLVRVGREVAGQRMSIATQQQALDRALALLMPNDQPAAASIAGATAGASGYRLF